MIMEQTTIYFISIIVLILSIILFCLIKKKKEKKAEKEKLVCSLYKEVMFNKGHTIYEFNKGTNELFKASVKKIDSKKNKAIVELKENYYYITALNPKNAIRKICNELNVRYVIDATNE